MSFRVLSLAGCWLGCLALQAAWADEPLATYIFPAGGQAGTVCQVRIGGLNLHDGCGCEMLGPGVAAGPALKKIKTVWFEGPMLEQPESQRQENYPQDFAGQIMVAAGASPGVRYLRTWTSQGASPALKFIVGELPEVVEEEFEGEPVPVTVELPVTINGRIFPREDVDIWSFRARRGEALRAEVFARRLGSPLEARLEITDEAGHRLAENRGLAGSDSALEFTPPADGEYQVHIYDVNFEGLQNYVYRLSLSREPRVDAVYPLGGRRGNAVRFELTGFSVPAAPCEVTLPTIADATCLHRFEFPGSASAGSASGRTASAGDASGLRRTNPVAIELGDLPEVLEQEPNDDAEHSAAFTAGTVLNGRIGRPGDADWYQIVAKKGEKLDVDLAASRLGSPLDAILVVVDAAGKELMRADDIVAGQTDARLRFGPPADGTYFLRVEDRLASRGGPTFAYRLRVAAAEPNFRIVLAGDAVTVLRGGQGKVRVNVDTIAPLDGPLELTVEGLPEGVTLATPQIPAKSAQFELKFSAAESAEIGIAHLVIRGTLHDKTAGDITRTAAPASQYGESPLDSVALAVAMPTPFKLVGTYASPSLPRGTIYAKRFAIERNGYTGSLEIRLADRQNRHLQGVTGPVITVPADASEFEYPTVMPPWMEMGRTSRAVIQASGTVFDSHGRSHVVSFSSQAQNDQMIVRVGGSLLELSTDQSSLRVLPGAAAAVTVHLARDASVTSPVRLELILPPKSAGIAAEPVVVAGEGSTATLHVRFAKDCVPGTMPLMIRATATMQDQPLVAETQLELIGQMAGHD